MSKIISCAQCGCSPIQCDTILSINCNKCTKISCCCNTIHTNSKFLLLFYHARSLFAAALGIEILCISAALIGENSAYYFFGYGLEGIILGYVLGYIAAGFATFLTILGRFDYKNTRIDSCCSVLEEHSGKGFLQNLIMTFKNFGEGISKLPSIYSQPNVKKILKTSIVILFTAESACILTAETIDLVLYKYSILLSVPSALLVGSFTVVAPEAYKKMKNNSK